MKNALVIAVIILLFALGFIVFSGNKTLNTVINPLPTPKEEINPLAISAMRERNYPVSDIVIEETLSDGTGYSQYIASYLSDGLKIYALLTIPIGDLRPTSGWPVIVFNHGYIAPDQYQTYPNVGQYASYYPVFSEAGYIVFKPDYRGNGDSEGTPEGAYYSPAYTVDVLNALASIRKYAVANPEKIGFWGHSLGGSITLRSLVVRPEEIKAAVIWGGVVGSYEDLMFNWQRSVPFRPSQREMSLRNNRRSNLVERYGDPRKNPDFWNSLDPTNFIPDIMTPVQVITGEADEEVPAAFSRSLRDRLQKAGKTVEYVEYPGDNHNISQNFNDAMRKSLDFFDKYLK